MTDVADAARTSDGTIADGMSAADAALDAVTTDAPGAGEEVVVIIVDGGEAQ